MLLVNLVKEFYVYYYYYYFGYMERINAHKQNNQTKLTKRGIATPTSSADPRKARRGTPKEVVKDRTSQMNDQNINQQESLLPDCPHERCDRP